MHFLLSIFYIYFSLPPPLPLLSVRYLTTIIPLLSVRHLMTIIPALSVRYLTTIIPLFSVRYLTTIQPTSGAMEFHGTPKRLAAVGTFAKQHVARILCHVVNVMPLCFKDVSYGRKRLISRFRPPCRIAGHSEFKVKNVIANTSAKAYSKQC